MESQSQEQISTAVKEGDLEANMAEITKVCEELKQLQGNVGQDSSSNNPLKETSNLLPPQLQQQPMNQEELDTWLAEVELAHQQIMKLKDDKISLDEFDKQQQRKEMKKKTEQEYKERQEKEALELKKKGRYGKGEKNTYKSFCKFCFREYELETPKCLQCSKQTQTYEERITHLKSKVKDFHENKVRKEDRKKKWELWKKTQAMLWKKTATNYSKWDYFTSSSEEENDNSEPIVPSDDPNFKAIEMDIQQRSKRRQQDRIKAEELKNRGNEYMKAGQYEQAAVMYTEGLDTCRDYKPLWTNRALCWINMKMYKKAIKDCTQLIEYCECFEDGYVKSKEFTYKAFLRRASAYKERKQYNEALEDLEQCNKLNPKSKEVASLKSEVLLLKQHQVDALKLLQGQQQQQSPKDDNKEENEELKEEAQTNNKQESEKKEQDARIKPQAAATAVKAAKSSKKTNFEQIDDFLAIEPAKIQSGDLEKIHKILLEDQKDGKIYFFEKKGIPFLINLICCHKINCALLIQNMVQDNPIYSDSFFQHQGCQILHIYIDSLLKAAESNQKNYDDAEDCFEVLISVSLIEKVRNKLKDSTDVVKFLRNCFEILIPKYQTEVPLLSCFFVYLSNLCYQDSLVKNSFTQIDFGKLMQQLFPIVQLEKRRSKYELLRENVYQLITNFLANPDIRQQFSDGKYTYFLEALISQLPKYDLSKNLKYLAVSETALSVLVNLSFQANQACQELMNHLQVGEVLVNRFLLSLDYKNLKFKLIFQRTLQILSKMSFSSPSLVQMVESRQLAAELIKFTDSFSVENDFYNNCIRLYISLYTCKELQPKIANALSNLQYTTLINNIKLMIQREEEIPFCNSCLLCQYISQLVPDQLEKFREIVPRLITVVRDQVGNKRKNAGILLGQLAKNPKNLELIRQLHGIEVLHSVLPYIVDKK